MTRPIVTMEGIEKHFPGVHALQDVAFELLPGEVHALIGENGAGKSTLMKILAGIYLKDAGAVRIGGDEVDILSPRAAQDLGISMIHQELSDIHTPGDAVRAGIGYLSEDRKQFGLATGMDVRANIAMASLVCAAHAADRLGHGAPVPRTCRHRGKILRSVGHRAQDKAVRLEQFAADAERG